MVRRRVEIKRIEDRSKRQVTFTKRRQGLFKKAGELCKKCDAEIAVMAISAAGNFYAFGNPTFESVIERYMAVKTKESDRDSAGMNPEASNLGLGSADAKEDDDDDLGLDLRLAPLTTATREEVVLKNDPGGKLDLGSLDELNGDELQQLIAQMEHMKQRIVDRANEIKRK